MTLTDNKEATICLRKAKVIKSEIKEIPKCTKEVVLFRLTQFYIINTNHSY